jgi:hypothetical protein
VAASHQTGRAGAGGRRDFFRRCTRVAQKLPKAHFTRTVATQRPNTHAALGALNQPCQQQGPLFCRRASPNRPSITPISMLPIRSRRSSSPRSDAAQEGAQSTMCACGRVGGAWGPLGPGWYRSQPNLGCGRRDATSPSVSLRRDVTKASGREGPPVANGRENSVAVNSARCVGRYLPCCD